MGVDYKIEVYRHEDDKKIASFWCNQIKSILDSQFANEIHCDHRRCDNVRFNPAELYSISARVQEHIEKLYSKILEKKLMIPLSQNAEIKNGFEADIHEIQEEIQDYFSVHSSVSTVYGMISCVVEDLCHYEKCDENNEPIPAYEYNAEGTDESSIWNHDVYCVIKAYW